eukprot:CAMPEP_0175039128 /NCGR_PEP_ID=MMETSP0052_2-20121109/348_1 /TAXON_ID=51329 ORGANISM="Polytomella parva, Strain SAG 63-3" /NCGR_SAMPLE_ID=MMETSP0052_2 /ASSEMBLY_ACC=CAM_ASM_000194 /LENGTH=452 /DNA_ID=CAMNT_0016300819 /DNA_START=565 /DNA_END=1923 /DNA_ORIENTATION=+
MTESSNGASDYPGNRGVTTESRGPRINDGAAMQWNNNKRLIRRNMTRFFYDELIDIEKRMFETVTLKIKEKLQPSFKCCVLTPNVPQIELDLSLSKYGKMYKAATRLQKDPQEIHKIRKENVFTSVPYELARVSVPPSPSAPPPSIRPILRSQSRSRLDSDHERNNDSSLPRTPSSVSFQFGEEPRGRGSGTVPQYREPMPPASPSVSSVRNKKQSDTLISLKTSCEDIWIDFSSKMNSSFAAVTKDRREESSSEEDGRRSSRTSQSSNSSKNRLKFQSIYVSLAIERSIQFICQSFFEKVFFFSNVYCNKGTGEWIRNLSSELKTWIQGDLLPQLNEGSIGTDSKSRERTGRSSSRGRSGLRDRHTSRDDSENTRGQSNNSSTNLFSESVRVMLHFVEVLNQLGTFLIECERNSLSEGHMRDNDGNIIDDKKFPLLTDDQKKAIQEHFKRK